MKFYLGLIFILAGYTIGYWGAVNILRWPGIDKGAQLGTDAPSFATLIGFPGITAKPAGGTGVTVHHPIPFHTGVPKPGSGTTGQPSANVSPPSSGGGAAITPMPGYTPPNMGPNGGVPGGGGLTVNGKPGYYNA